MKIESLGDDLHVLIGEAYESNSTVFIRGSDALLIDTMGSTADALQLRDWLAQRQLTVRAIVMTHYFSDHMAGLRLFPEAVVIAHRACDETFAREQFRTDEEAAFYVAPTLRLDGDAQLHWGNYTLNIFPNAGHTESTLNIDVPEADLVFTADNVVGNIYYLRYTNVARAAEALSKLSAIGRSRILSSHAGVRNASAIGSAAHYVATFASGSRDADVQTFLPRDVIATDTDAHFHSRNIAT
ncbi:MAG TPA: MBL fold metallo-hydrolase [Thermoanaerobaculia bacterium]|nr:MBL fold metallo-hydrolase [Thermoanaerobaculia bacterium]